MSRIRFKVHFWAATMMVTAVLSGNWALTPAVAQTTSQPNSNEAQVVKPNYAQAKQYSSRYLRQFVYSSSIRPTWIGKSDLFWYSYRTSLGTKYYLVDAKRAIKDQLFDHQKLAALLSVETRKPVDSNNLSLSGLKVAEDRKSLTFRSGRTSFKYDLENEKLEKVQKKVAPKTAPKKTETAEKKTVKKNDKTDNNKKDTKKKTKKKSDTKKDDKSKSVEKKGSKSDKKDGTKDQKKNSKNEKSKQDKDEKSKTKSSSSKSKTVTKKTTKKRQAEYRSFSPDRKSYVFAKGHDLYFVKIPKNYKPPGKTKKKPVKKESTKKTDKSKKSKDQEKKEVENKKETSKTDKKKTDSKDKKVTKNDDQKKKESKDAKKDDKGSKEKKDEKKPIPAMDPKLDAKAVRLTKDGAENFSFARGSGRGRFSRGSTSTTKIDEKTKTRPQVSWSEDSKSFYVNRYDRRNVKKLFVINSLSNPRPKLEQYSYPMPGEEGIWIQHLYYFDAANTKLVRVDQKWKHETYRNVHWNKSGEKLRFGRHDRLLRNVEFCEVHLPTGKTKCMISDGFEAAFYESRSARYLKDSDEMIWWSEKTGWGHYYLYDRDGNFKNAITSGPFRSSRIVSIDEKNRLMYFYANGREAGENIYHQHLYRIRLDGTGLTLLDPGSANHRSSLSPSKKFVVDNFSAVDKAPTAVLRDANGKKVLDLESSDLSRLKEVGWKMPSTFVVKAADGVTNLYGNMWKPFNFDPTKKYPVIAHVYPGPQTEGTSHTFSATAGNQQLAQLGFIVIQVGHRGGTPQRSKAYARYGYYNLRDYGLADKKAAIEQLAQRFPFVDVKRVGIYGHSGGGFMTATALLLPPYNDFFTAGFSTAGNHDNNIYNNSWSERYHGLKLVKKSSSKVTKKTTTTTTSTTDERRRQLEELIRRRRRQSGPDSSFDYAAGQVTESDFFFEHEGEIDPSTSGPEAFLNQDKKKKVQKDQKKTSKTVQKSKATVSNKKKDTKKTSTKKETNKNDQMKFEIRVPTTVELAENLKGHLFLVHGEADSNVHPANTLRLVDALIKKNKRFDMLYLPATRHGFGRYQPYVTQRMYEFFAEHLMNDYQDDADLSEVK